MFVKTFRYQHYINLRSKLLTKKNVPLPDSALIPGFCVSIDENYLLLLFLGINLDFFSKEVCFYYEWKLIKQFLTKFFLQEIFQSK